MRIALFLKSSACAGSIAARAFAFSAIGLPASIESDMHALRKPATIATAKPFARLNSDEPPSAPDAFASRSFIMPATPFIAIPSAQMNTPMSTRSPARSEAISRILPDLIGGMSVPTNAQKPRATAVPKPIPK